MELYSIRNGKRAPLEKTYVINNARYTLLLNVCKNHEKNLTHLFNQNKYHDFTEKDYIAFDRINYLARIKNKISNLYVSKSGELEAPDLEDEYDQYALLDLIEFFAQNIKDINERWNNNQYRNYKMIDILNTSNIFYNYQSSINEIFSESGLLYTLTDEKIIERLVENSTLTSDIEDTISEVKEIGLRALLLDAVNLYKTPNPSSRQDSVEKIWDALERLKTYYLSLDKRNSVNKIISNMSNGNDNFSKLFNKEFVELTKIGNDFRIRHHETNKIEITDPKYYDYFFNRCLSLIAIAIEYLD